MIQLLRVDAPQAFAFGNGDTEQARAALDAVRAATLAAAARRAFDTAYVCVSEISEQMHADLVRNAL